MSESSIIDRDQEDQEDRKYRYFEYGGIKFTLSYTDPYGFWTIYRTSGETPQELYGQFTSFDEAQKQIISYMNTVKHRKDVESLTKPPKIERVPQNYDMTDKKTNKKKYQAEEVF